MSVVSQSVERERIDYPELARRIGAGDRAAETELLQAIQPGVRALVRRHARPNDPIVDDIVQDALRQLIERLRASALDSPEALPAYVRGTVVLMVRAEYRRRGRRGENNESASPEDLPDPDEPSENTRREQLRAGVRTVLAELKVPRDREILRRYYLDEEDRDSVCAALAIDPEHFHRVLFRARERLRQRLTRAGLGESP